jgi:hypothetical protein
MTREYMNGAYFAKVGGYSFFYFERVLFNYFNCVFGEFFDFWEIDDFAGPD